MAGAKLEKTRWPGIYRRGTRWVYAWTDATGNARRGTADTREEASRLKAEEEQRAIRRDIERYWLPPLGRRPLADITTPALGRVIGDLAARDGDSYLADRTLRRLFAPMAALMATAVDEGFIPHNPARDVTLPSGRDALRRFDPDADEDTDDPSPGKARSLTGEQLGAFLLVTDDRWRLLFELLAATGLRISEAIALRWRDLRLDGDRAAVRVRRARVKGHYGPPKSRHGNREVPLPFELVRALRERRSASEWHEDDDLVFPSGAGTPMLPENLHRRVLKPTAEEAGVPWAGFHSFRHTCASMLINDGRNIVQVSRWLGHHSPSFTLDVYAHLMDDGVGEPLEVSGVTSGSRSALRPTSDAMEPASGNSPFAAAFQSGRNPPNSGRGIIIRVSGVRVPPRASSRLQRTARPARAERTSRKHCQDHRSTGATVRGMARDLTQRELRNDSGEIMRALDAGETFRVTRNGVPVGELTPMRRRQFVARDTALAAFVTAAAIDPDQFRADVDGPLEQDPTPRG
jgi:integrase/antitoxin (DNA-binding transcriptional repressor) of toxin-antitoxin stability system